MRIVLKKGKQRELIELAKEDRTWKQLAMLLGICEQYIRKDLRRENILLADCIYKKLQEIAKVNFDEFILETKEDNWGRAKGGANSGESNSKHFIEPPENKELAELFGIILGDGHLDEIKIGPKVRVYAVTIAGDSFNDNKYLHSYVKVLFEKLLGEGGTFSQAKHSNSCYLKVHGKKIVEFIKKKGISPGNKKFNNQGIPDWIFNNLAYLRACLRGLIDADGCIYYISKKTNRNLRISFTSYIPALMKDVRNSFIKLGFHPSKIVCDKNIYISRKDDVNKFIKEIGFSNDKHLKRLQNLRNNAPVI